MLPALGVLVVGLIARWALLTRILPKVLGYTGAIGRRYLERVASPSLIIVGALSLRAFAMATGYDQAFRIGDLLLVFLTGFLLIEGLRSFLVDYYLVKVRGHVVPRLFVSLA